MVTLDFDKPLLSTKGDETRQHLGEILSDLLSTETKGNVRKLYDWSRTLAKHKPLILDAADKKVLTDLVENNDRVIILVKGQILDVIEAAKEEV